MPRYKLGSRVTGPYYCEARSKWRIFVYDGPKPTVLWFATESAARKGILTAAQNLSTSESRLLGELIAQYYAEKQQRGIATASTCPHQIVRMRPFFAPYLDQDISRVTPRRAAALYEQHTVNPCPRSRRPPAAASQHLDLYITRCFFKWAARKHLVDQSPFHDVQLIGRASTGKPQLRLDEAKRYREAALRLFDQNHDRFALAAVIPLYLGMRAGEVLSRCVRDVDADGSILWIDRGK